MRHSITSSSLSMSLIASSAVAATMTALVAGSDTYSPTSLPDDSVLCPGFDSSRYCDCSGDCTYSNFCDCDAGRECCSSRQPLSDSVLCPGFDSSNYCDCDGDCTETNFCDCNAGRECCSNASPTYSLSDQPSTRNVHNGGVYNLPPPYDAADGTEAASPTYTPTGTSDCYSPAPPRVLGSICMSNKNKTATIPIPKEALVVVNQDGVKVGLTVKQLWRETVGMAIMHDETVASPSCVVKENVGLNTSQDLVGECIGGVTEMTIVVYFDPSFDPEQCKACEVDDLSEMGADFCAYRIEIPCESESVKCGDPSVAISGSFFPSTIPTGSPSKSPLTPPDDAAKDTKTENPITTTIDFGLYNPPPSIVTTTCPDDLSLKRTTGATPFPSDITSVVQILSQDTRTVTIQLTQAFTTTTENNNSIDQIYYQYKETLFSEKCYEESDVGLFETYVDELTIQCTVMSSYAYLELCFVDDASKKFLIEGEDDADIPKCCHADVGNKPSVCYTLEISCKESLGCSGVDSFVGRRLGRTLLRADRQGE